MKGISVKPTDLNQRDVYVSPQGHRCVLKPADPNGCWGKYFIFAYLERPGGFTFTSANVAHLRRELR